MSRRERRKRDHRSSTRRTDPFADVLGPLEQEVMEIIWQLGDVTIHDVHMALAARRALAYTTVSTTMTRLSHKGLLACDADTVPHRFRPAIVRDEYANYITRSLFDWLVTHFPKPSVSYFVERIRDDPKAIERLRREISLRSRSEHTVRLAPGSKNRTNEGND